MAYCYGIDGKIWDTLLCDDCKSLLDELDSEQTAKARAMQRVDRLSGHDLRLLRRQDPRLDVQHDAFSVQYAGDGAAPDIAQFLQMG